jgi:hypothetical protein
MRNLPRHGGQDGGKWLTVERREVLLDDAGPRKEQGKRQRPLIGAATRSDHEIRPSRGLRCGGSAAHGPFERRRDRERELLHSLIRAHDGDARIKDLLEPAAQQTDRLAPFTEALLDVSRITAGRLELDPQELAASF